VRVWQHDVVRATFALQRKYYWPRRPQGHGCHLPLGSKMEEMSARDILWDVHVVLALAKETSGAL